MPWLFGSISANDFLAHFPLQTSTDHKTNVWGGIWMGPKKIENSKPLLLDCSIDGDNMIIKKEICSKEWRVSKKAILGQSKRKTCPYVLTTCINIKLTTMMKWQG